MKEVSFCVYCGQVSTYPTHWVRYFLCLRIVKLKKITGMHSNLMEV